MSARGWLRSALACGALPLSVGVLIFLLWLPTRWSGLELLGLLTLLGGGFLFVVGIACVIVYVGVARRETPGAPIGRNAVLAAGLLCLNFPVAGAIVPAAYSLHTRYTIDVVNESSEPATDVTVSGGGVRLDLGDLSPGALVRRSVHIQHDGDLRLEGRQGGRALAATGGYVTNGLGGHVLFRVRDGTVEMTELR